MVEKIKHFKSKVGLIFKDKSEMAFLIDIFQKHHYAAIPIETIEDFKEMESELFCVLMDEASTKKFLKGLSSSTKRKGHDYFLPVIIVLESEKNLLEWQEDEIFDIIIRPINENKILWCFQKIRAIISRLEYFKVVQLDHSQRKKAENELTYLAYHDMLTGLANRSMLEHSLTKAIAFAKRGGTKVAVLFLDLDHFKIVNDSMGHELGDRLLQEVAKKLQYSIRITDLVARQGGDEFVIVLNGISSIETINQVANKIREIIEKSLIIEGREFYITTSIGISVYPDNGTDAQALLKNADSAMYLAKDYGRNTIQFCTPELTRQVQERANQENSLRLALKENQLVLHYQPKLEIKTGKISGIEALIRWKKNNEELVYPESFITLAEDTGLIIPITEWVLRRSFKESLSWQAMGFDSISLAVNLSLRNLKDENIIVTLQNILQETGYDPRKLKFEITESLISRDMKNTTSILNAFKKIGVHLSIDDFGTGYSFLSYLKQFAVNELKIDKTFIDDISFNKNDASIVKAIIAMAHSLNIKVVAEGVETQEQLEFLKKAQCDEIQGFYFSRALPLNELLLFLKNHH